MSTVPNTYGLILRPLKPNNDMAPRLLPIFGFLLLALVGISWACWHAYTSDSWFQLAPEGTDRSHWTVLPDSLYARVTGPEARHERAERLLRRAAVVKLTTEQAAVFTDGALDSTGQGFFLLRAVARGGDGEWSVTVSPAGDSVEVFFSGLGGLFPAMPPMERTPLVMRLERPPHIVYHDILLGM